MLKRFVSLSFLAFVLSSCAYTGTVRSRAAYDLDCSEEKINVKNIGGYSYAAVGCGKSSSYTCSEFGILGMSCTKESPKR